MLRVPPILRLILAVALVGCGPTGPEAPDAPWLTGPTRAEHAALFPIDGGIHDGAACDTCHGDTETFADVQCTACHVHRAEVTDPAHEGLEGYVYDGNACYGCHPSGSVEAFEGHEVIFPIADGTPHGDESCAGCHLSRADRSLVTCTDCHAHEEPDMDATHGAVVDYVYATASCRSCHPDGSVSISRAAHELYFPIDSGSAHFDSSCADCHIDPSDRLNLACTECHEHAPEAARADHARVGGFALGAASCLLCHPGASVAPVADHLPFRIDGGSKHRPSEAGCLECHTGRTTPNAFPAADFTSLDCSLCHSRARMDDKHDEEPRYRYDPRTCIQSGCHPTGEEADGD